MKSRHAPSPAGGPEALPNARARRARRIPGARLRTAATLLVLAAVAVAFLLYDGAGTLPTGAWIVAPSMPEWQQVPDAMPGHAFAQVPQQGAFVTTWATTSPDESVTIPANGTYTIDWGDGTVGDGVTDHQTHEYAAGRHPHRLHIRRPRKHPGWQRNRRKRGQAAIDRTVGEHRMDHNE